MRCQHCQYAIYPFRDGWRRDPRYDLFPRTCLGNETLRHEPVPMTTVEIVVEQAERERRRVARKAAGRIRGLVRQQRREP